MKNEQNEYDTIADLYDSYVQTTLDIPFLLSEAKQAGGEVLELMCGTGRISLPLAEAGVQLTCVDLSGEMLAILDEKLKRGKLNARLVQADVSKLDLGKKFELVLLPFNSFGEILKAEDQKEALRRIREHLAPGGRFILTLHNPAVRAQTVDGRVRLWGHHPMPDGQGNLVLWGWQDFAEATQRIVKVLQFYEEYDMQGVMQAKRLLELRFCLMSREEVESMTQEAGFTIEAMYGNYDGSEFDPLESPFMLWRLV